MKISFTEQNRLYEKGIESAREAFELDPDEIDQEAAELLLGMKLDQIIQDREERG